MSLILPQHQMAMSNLKKEGYTIVGYCRKSTQPRLRESLSYRVDCIQGMINNAYQRSLADCVFVSPIHNTVDPILERDKSIKHDSTSKEIVDKLRVCSGNLQGTVCLLHVVGKLLFVILIYYIRYAQVHREKG